MLALLLPLVLSAGLLGLPAVTAGEVSPVDAVGPIDPAATAETAALFTNLRSFSQAGTEVLFGHQDSLAYGVGWSGDPGRSDVHDVTGAYPAVYGWDIGGIEHANAANLDGVDFDAMQQWIREGHERGGVITVSWHVGNPVTGGNSWDSAPAIATILPGGENEELYRTWLDRVALFMNELKDVPIIFRPFHEMTGDWFWWGGSNVTPEQYQQLFRFTVEYLRDVRGVHNLLYAYSPDRNNTVTAEQFLVYYPGDEYVDVLGIDDYASLASDETVPELTLRLAMVVGVAEERGKIPAFTETGQEAIPEPDWWTTRLLAAITADPAAQRIAWVLVWRNDSETHHFAPYLGHPSAPDFVAFYDHPVTTFGDTMPDLYATG